VVVTSSSYRRPLPVTLVSFSSAEGRVLFREALEDGAMESFFPLIEQFHTQADPAFCGLASLVMALNALGVDPGRIWRGPWRWFSEELLDCCTPLEQVRKAGVSLEEVACLARCNGADGQLFHADVHGLEAFRATVQLATRSTDRVLIASYDRGALGQTGAGHFSPIGGYHAGRDLALLLDVARFKYPPHWVPLSTLYAATQDIDPDSQRPRGWLLLHKRSAPSAVTHFLICKDGIAIKDAVQELLVSHAERLREHPDATLADVLHASAAAVEASGLLSRVQFRAPQTSEHVVLLGALESAISALPLYRSAADLLGGERAMPVVVWLLGAPSHLWSALSAPLAREMLNLLDTEIIPAPLADEVSLLRSQIEFLLEHAGRGATVPALS
jgi:glutathione gamma-glutamylcysteinyltransferase